jgi:O-antigen ligase
MTKEVKETRLTSILFLGSLVVTLLITDRIGTDPVNVGKMLAVSTLGFSLIAFYEFKTLIFSILLKILLTLLLIFNLTLFSSAILSDNAFERGLYGAFGRNTGALTYLSLSLIFISCFFVTKISNFSKIIRSLFYCGLLNVIYCLFASTGNDIFTWQNQFNAVLGTFGNPNFIGAFMGIFLTLLAVQMMDLWNRKSALALLSIIFVLASYVLWLSSALQGTAITAVGIALGIYLKIRTNVKWNKLAMPYLFLLLALGVLSLFGVVNKGPLSPYLYKTSVTFRWEYWKAGINMATSSFFSGVGIDSYGSNYRLFRDASAVKFPGADVTTDAAHNVVIDIWAGSGVLAMTSYLAINLTILALCVRFIKRNRSFDPVFSSLFLCWLSWQLQSLVSINQIGLAIWGWLLGGLLVSYTLKFPDGNVVNIFPVRQHKKTKTIGKAKVEPQSLDPKVLLKIIAFSLMGFLVALPPFIADAKMRSTQLGKSDVEQIIKLAEAWPLDSMRINRLTVTLAGNGKIEESAYLASFATQKFPNDFAGWKALYDLSPENSPQKKAYKSKLQLLDPQNPEWK